MSSILRRTDPDEPRPPLTDPDETSRISREIKATLAAKAFAFEDILAKMGIARPGALSEVTFEDFSRVVLDYCGPARFSPHQTKSVFREVAQNVANADPVTLSGAYIVMKDFKDAFFPGKAWKPQVDDASEERRRMERLGRDSDFGDGTSESVAISTVMQGRTNAEIYEAREAEERRRLMHEQLRQRQAGDTLLDDFERVSDGSNAIDDIIAIRANDPRKMKPGQESGDVCSAFTNPKFFRQAEVSLKQRRAI